MGITTAVEERLKAVLDATALQVGREKLTPWQQGFIDSQRERYEKYGAGIFLSPKQMNVINEVHAKVVGTPDDGTWGDDGDTEE